MNDQQLYKEMFHVIQEGGPECISQNPHQKQGAMVRAYNPQGTRKWKVPWGLLASQSHQVSKF